jgi:probable HAF family extracellular repeat protein
MDRVVGGLRHSVAALALPALLLAATSPAGAQSSPPRYSIVELAGVPQRLNNSGQIAGWVYVGADAHAAVYSGGTWRDLGVPAGDQLSALYGINDAGAVAGFSFVSLPGTPNPDNRWRAVWAPAGATAVQVLSVIAPDSFNYAINDAGSIVGCLNRYDDDYPDPHRAFLYANGSVIDLHALLTTPPGAGPFDYSCALDVNKNGVVVGEVQTSANPTRGFVYRNGAVSRIEQGTSYLTTARAISSTGKVVGDGRLAGFSADHGLLYDVATGVVSSLGLEATGAYNSKANDVNARGDAVGMMFLNVGEHAFLSSAGHVFDLNDLVPAGGEWVLQEAFSINDSGQIVGRGYLSSSPTVTRYFLMQAVPALTSIADLIAQVRALEAAGFLSHGNANGLVAELRVAESHLRGRCSRLSVLALEIFVRHVDLLIRTGRLSPTKGQPLVDGANLIIDSLTGAAPAVKLVKHASLPKARFLRR